MKLRVSLAALAFVAGVALVLFAGFAWQVAEKYEHTFVLKRAAAGLKYDDNTIAFLKKGKAIARLATAGAVAAFVAGAWGLRRAGRGAGTSRESGDSPRA